MPSVECNENGNPCARTQWAWQWGAGSANNCCQTVFHEKCAHCIGPVGVAEGRGGKCIGNCVVYARLLRLSSSATVNVAVAVAVAVVAGLDMPLVAMHANKI